MHMRPTRLFVSTMAAYPCDVTIVFNGKSLNDKRIIHLMAACIKQGREIKIRCSGDQEQDVLKAAVDLVVSALGDAGAVQGGTRGRGTAL